jgi:hypothetical protein
MVAVHAAAGHKRGMDQSARWEMYPGYLDEAPVEKELPTVGQVAGMFGGQAQFDWSEVERLAEQLNASGGTR